MLEAGLALVPVNPKLGRSELEHVLTDSAPDVILGAPDGELPTAPAARPSTCDARGGDLPEPRAGDEDPALIVYTSGTTGRPKGAVLPRRCVTSNLDALADAWAWTGADVLTHGLPLFHVHGLAIGVLGPLRRGGELRHLGRFEPAAAAAALRDGATMLFGVPTMYHRIAREAEQDAAIADGLRAARLLVSGSAPLPAPVFTRIEELSGQQIVERYGLTETLMNTAVRADSPRRPGYVGVPLEGVEVRLVADDGSDVEVSDDETIGEVAVRGPNVFSGYLNRPDATAEAIRDGWFFTGDIAHARAGRLLAHRRPPLDGPDQDRRLQGRRGRDRGRPARAPRRARGGGDRRARRRPRRADRRLGRRRGASRPTSAS